MSKSIKSQERDDGHTVMLAEAGQEEDHPIAPITSATDFGCVRPR